MTTTDKIKRIEQRIAERAPANQSAIPIATSQERHDDGSLTWHVDLHIKEPGQPDITLETQGETLDKALNEAFRQLSRWTFITNRALLAESRFNLQQVA